MENEQMNDFNIIEKKKRGIGITFAIILAVFITILVILIVGFAIYNGSNEKIVSGIYVKGIKVSGLTKEQAKQKVETQIKEKMPENVTLKHGDNVEAILNIEQMEAKFDIDAAITKAYEIGRSGNIFENNLEIFKVMITKINVEPAFTVNEEELVYMLGDISTKLPDTVVQSSYYIDESNLIVTRGKEGQIVDVETMKNIIFKEMKDLTYYNKKIEMITLTKSPDTVDIDKIYSEIYKEPVDAYYSTNPFIVHPSENGVDFKISVEEAKQMLAEVKDEYVIPLKTIKPNVTTNMIGSEAFPDLVSSFSTKYNTRDKDRTTNLILAANKINGTVLMPGETFSYNQVVGKRTIDAGYKEAKIYQNGEVIDGLGGGICQISTTLYNAALYANMQILERRNHQFVPSYVSAGRDATVVYGSTDFKFKNTRSYPVKVQITVSGGIAKVNIFGLSEQNEYEVEITSSVTNKTATSINSTAYKILKQYGQVISKEILSKDTYKRH